MNKDIFNKLAKKLAEARKKDPNWKKAIEAWADAEVKLAKEDPAEGKTITKFVPKKK